MGSFLLLAFVFLIAGVIAVPIASKLGLGSVLGYLIAGIVISPLLVTLQVDVVSLQHFAEFGVVMMLFLVGLELEPRLLWQMKARLLGLGGLQVLVTTALVMGAALAIGQVWSVALATGLVLALSSTAIVLQTLNEKGLLKCDGGQGAFSILLFQDIAVIPMLALIPLLALPELSGVAVGDDHGGHGFIETLAGWQRTVLTLAAIAAVIIGGSYLTRPVFRFIAVAKLRELFVATALLMVIGIALLMSFVGLSPALGTFLAGVVLANSEYRHELESDIEPFKGLLLGLFFMTVGAGINFALLFDNVGFIVGLTVGLMLIKFTVVWVLGGFFKVTGANRWLMALSLAQAGEFGFVLLSFTVANAVIPQAFADQLLLVVALSMLLTPLLFIVYDRVIVPRSAVVQSREADTIDTPGTVIVAGHGRFGGIINRLLLGAGVSTVVLDHSSAQLELLRTFDVKVFFGDATRPDLLHAAGIESAAMLVIAIDDREQTTGLVQYVHHNFPHIHIVTRAFDRTHVYELYAAGANDIIREYFDSAVRAGRSALEGLGYHPYDAELKAQEFVEHDKYMLRTVAPLYRADVPLSENTEYVDKVKELGAIQRQRMLGRQGSMSSRSARGWVPPTQKDVPKNQ